MPAKIPVSTLEVEYGKFLFGKLLNRYPDIVQNAQSTFKFLQLVDEHVHVEVLKLYPEAELPRFECTRIKSRLHDYEIQFQSSLC